MFKFVLAVFFCGLTAQAAPAPEFLGTYAFNQTELKITQIQHLVTVAVRNDEAKNFVNSLKKQGYQCQLAPNSMSKCKKFDRGIIEDADLRADIVREFFNHDDESYFYLNSGSQISQQISAVKINQKLNLNVVDDRIVYLYEAVWTK